MDIIQMPIKIALITGGMFPKRRSHIHRSNFICLLVDIRSLGSIALEQESI